MRLVRAIRQHDEVGRQSSRQMSRSSRSGQRIAAIVRSLHALMDRLVPHHWTAYVLVGLALAAAMIVNLLLLPGEHLVSSLYAIPVLIASHRFAPRVVVALSGLSIALYLLSAYLEHRPMTVWPFGVLGLMMVGYLGVRYALHRIEIDQQLRDLEDARQNLQEFLGMVTHDLSGALTGVLGCAELLARNDHVASDETRWATMAINDAAGQMRRLLGDLRDAAAIGAGRFSITPELMDVAELTRLVAAQQQLMTDRHKIIVSVADRLEGCWDRERLRQLLTNLLSNAVKYSPDGGEVRVTVHPTRHSVRISVSDDGIGIPADQQAKLFEPFARLEQCHRATGSGLGLCITNAIAEAHGGRISIESLVGRGSTFHVDLPVVAPVIDNHGALSIHHSAVVEPVHRHGVHDVVTGTRGGA
jgi:signal transduction histidine kinase